MPDETYVTRREIDLLKAEADRERIKMWARIEGLDEHGSRGVGALTVRMDNMVTAMADLQSDVKSRFDAHEKEHERHDQEHEKEEARRSSNRWRAIGLAIAAVAAVDGPVVTIFLARGR